jgi:hypothetical protein
MAEYINSNNARHNIAPILFLLFNRPSKVEISFQKIKLAKPPRLYISIDGPRCGSDELAQKRCLEIIQSSIDWECEVKINQFRQNLGCKDGVMGGIDWFFMHEEEGIICEDDVVLSDEFFRFATYALERYRSAKDVFLVSADGRAGSLLNRPSSYFFTKFPTVWGWATWRDRWSVIDRDLNNFSEDLPEVLNNIGKKREVQRFWRHQFYSVYLKKLDTWDFHLAFYHFKGNFKSIIPSANLVKNIGFDNDATHTKEFNRDAVELKIGHFEGPYQACYEPMVSQQVDDWYQKQFVRKHFVYRLFQKLRKILEQ